MASSPVLSLPRAAEAIGILCRHLGLRSREKDPLGNGLIVFLNHVHTVRFPDASVQVSSHPIGAILANDLPSKNGMVDDAMNALRPLFPVLPWRYGYTSRPDLPGLENNMAWAELIGPAAPFHSGRVCLGITAIGPHTRYPEHSHPATEMYFVLSGTASWTADGIAYERHPGSYILHSSNVVHAMETGDEPLIAAYTWTGDILSPSVYADSP